MSNIETSKNKEIIADFVEYNEALYKEIDLDSLVVLALWRLEQVSLPLYFDLIVVASFKLFPKKFSMATFPEYPDTNRIDKAVRRLTDPKRKNWATGNVENGFFLSDFGREVAQQVERSILISDKPQEVSVLKRSRGRSSNDDVSDIRASDLFNIWKEGREGSPHEFFAFLKAAPYTPKELLLERIKILQQSASDVRDADVEMFLVWITSKYHNLIHPTI